MLSHQGTKQADFDYVVFTPCRTGSYSVLPQLCGCNGQSELTVIGILYASPPVLWQGAGRLALFNNSLVFNDRRHRCHNLTSALIVFGFVRGSPEHAEFNDLGCWTLDEDSQGSMWNSELIGPYTCAQIPRTGLVKNSAIAFLLSER